MAATFSFGSLGDILTLCQIGIELSRMLSSGRGSAKEYQDFRHEVDAYSEMLMQVAITCQERVASPAVEDLLRNTQKSVDDCGDLLKGELMRLYEKYNESLLQPDGSGSGSTMKDIFRKVKFGIQEKNRIQESMAKLNRYTQRIGVLIQVAGLKSARVDDATLDSRLRGLEELVEKETDSMSKWMEEMRRQAKTQADMLQEQNSQLQVISTQVTRARTSTCTILDRVEGMGATLVEIKDMVQLVAATRHFSDSNAHFFAGPDPTAGKPVYFEDSLGNVLEFPLQWIDDWESFDQLLQIHFRKRKGYQMVLQREFTLEESATGHDIDRNRPLRSCIRQGMKINMSMIFRNSGAAAVPLDVIDIYRECYNLGRQPLSLRLTLCPRCLGRRDTWEDIINQCPYKECGMWFEVLKPAASRGVGSGEPGKRMGWVMSRSASYRDIDRPVDFHRIRVYNRWKTLCPAPVWETILRFFCGQTLSFC